MQQDIAYTLDITHVIRVLERLRFNYEKFLKGYFATK